MKSVIVGGGKVGYYLLKTLAGRGYSVSLIERSEVRCREIAEDIDAEIICGDGTEIDVLSDAGIGKRTLLPPSPERTRKTLSYARLQSSAFISTKRSQE
jgi:trk system potassium uptake protein TrkA